MGKTLGVKFLKASLIYFIIGVTMGAIITIGPIGCGTKLKDTPHLNHQSFRTITKTLLPMSFF